MTNFIVQGCISLEFVTAVSLCLALMSAEEIFPDSSCTMNDVSGLKVMRAGRERERCDLFAWIWSSHENLRYVTSSAESASQKLDQGK